MVGYIILNSQFVLVPLKLFQFELFAMTSNLNIKVTDYWVNLTFQNTQIKIQVIPEQMLQQSAHNVQIHVGSIQQEFINAISCEGREYSKSVQLFFDYLQVLTQMSKGYNYNYTVNKRQCKKQEPKSNTNISLIMVCKVDSQKQYFVGSPSKVVLKIKNLDNQQLISNLKFQQGQKRYQNYYVIDLKTVSIDQSQYFKKIIKAETLRVNSLHQQFDRFRQTSFTKITSLQQKIQDQNLKMKQTLNDFLMQSLEKIQQQLKLQTPQQPLNFKKKKKIIQRVPEQISIAAIQGQLQQKQREDEERNKERQQKNNQINHALRQVSNLSSNNNNNNPQCNNQNLYNQNQKIQDNTKNYVKNEVKFQVKVQATQQEVGYRQIYDSNDQQNDIHPRPVVTNIYENYHKICIEFDQETTAFHHFSISNKKVIKIGGFDYVPMLLKYRIPQTGKHFISMKLCKIRKNACLWFGIVQQKVKKLLHSSNYKNFMVYKVNTCHVVTKVDEKQTKIKQRCVKLTSGQHISMEIDMDSNKIYWYLSNGGRASGQIPQQLRQMTLNPFIGIFNIFQKNTYFNFIILQHDIIIIKSFKSFMLFH